MELIRLATRSLYIMAISDKVRFYRKQKGWTQRELAHEAGVHHPRVAEIETGRSKSRIMAGRLLGAMGFRMKTFIVPVGGEYVLRRKDGKTSV